MKHAYFCAGAHQKLTLCPIVLSITKKWQLFRPPVTLVTVSTWIGFVPNGHGQGKGGRHLHAEEPKQL